MEFFKLKLIIESSIMHGFLRRTLIYIRKTIKVINFSITSLSSTLIFSDFFRHFPIFFVMGLWSIFFCVL